MDDFKLFLKWLFIGCVIAVWLAICVAFTSDILGVNSITAHAVDVVLTPSQTVALIGSEIPITYYNNTTGLTFDKTLHLLGTTDEIKYSNFNLDGGATIGATPWASITHANNTQETRYRSFNYAPALIYYTSFPFDDNLVFSNTTTHYNMQIDFSLDLQGLTNFRFPVYYSSRDSVGYGSRSDYTLFTSLGVQTGEVLHGSGAGTHVQGLFYLGDYRNTSDSEDAVNYFSLFPISREDYENPFSVSGLMVGMNGCATTDSVYCDSLRASGFIPGMFYNFYVLIGCPVVSDYVPPVTTSPITTTVPRSTYDWGGGVHATTPAYTVDLSTIEEQQRVQIEIENENRNYNSGTFDGINIIISQLDAIYSQMVARGEIAVDLLDGLYWSPGSDINNYINNGLTHTTARLPDTFNPDTINSLSDLFMNNSQFSRFAVIGFFSIAFGIFSWFVFRGRGGV